MEESAVEKVENTFLRLGILTDRYFVSCRFYKWDLLFLVVQEMGLLIPAEYHLCKTEMAEASALIFVLKYNPGFLEMHSMLLAVAVLCWHGFTEA